MLWPITKYYHMPDGTVYEVVDVRRDASASTTELSIRRQGSDLLGLLLLDDDTAVAANSLPDVIRRELEGLHAEWERQVAEAEAPASETPRSKI